MTLSGAQASWKLKTGATPTGTNVTGPVQIGEAGSQSYSAADVAYSCKVTGNAASDAFVLYLGNGVCTQTVGTGGTIADGDGLDFEAVTISMASIYSLLVKSPSSNTGDTTVANSESELPDFWMLSGSETAVQGSVSNGFSLGAGASCTITFPGAGDEVTVTVLGKST